MWMAGYVLGSWTVLGIKKHLPRATAILPKGFRIASETLQPIFEPWSWRQASSRWFPCLSPPWSELWNQQACACTSVLCGSWWRESLCRNPDKMKQRFLANWKLFTCRSNLFPVIFIANLKLFCTIVIYPSHSYTKFPSLVGTASLDIAAGILPSF